MSDREVFDACDHCALPLPESPPSADIKGRRYYFCCSGCATVFRAIHEANLERFYDYLKADRARSMEPPAPPSSDLEIYDLPEGRERFARNLSGSRHEAVLLLEAIHCSACVWLIERALISIDGIERVEANLTRRRVKVVWDEDRLRLSDIFRALERIGYAARPFSDAAEEASTRLRDRKFLYRIGFAGFAMMNVMWPSVALWFGAYVDQFRDLFIVVSFALATPTLFYSGWPFLRAAAIGLFRAGHLTMDFLISFGALSGYFYSVAVMLGFFGADAHVYFDTVIALIFFISIGRYLDFSARRKSTDAIKALIESRPRSFILIDANGLERLTAIERAREGDRILIKPGALTPLDCVVLEGSSSVDESILTGESRPVLKSVGDRLWTGSMNDSSALIARCVARPGSDHISKMVEFIAAAQSSKSPIARLADRVVPYFAIGAFSLALITFLYWFATASLSDAILAGMSVLIITCPCALGLAAPLAVAASTGYGANRGIMIKSAAALERLAKVDRVVFDKTGALTEGKMVARGIKPTDRLDERAVLAIAASLERYSSHLFARAILARARKDGVELLDVESFESITGFGARGLIDGKEALVGSIKFLRADRVDLGAHESEFDSEEVFASAAYVAFDRRFVGRILIEDRIRDSAEATIGNLRSRGKKISILTGDRAPIAERLAEAIGGVDDVSAEALPEEKAEYIRRARSNGEVVAMVGDGVNDALALVEADIGIAIETGADIATASADIALTGGGLSRVVESIDLAERALRVIKMNLAFSIGYNLIAVPIAMGGLLTPLVAALAMSGSSLIVTLNSLRLRRRST